ncbi:unnamed protein product [Hapterophycus canaliculatus]
MSGHGDGNGNSGGCDARSTGGEESLLIKGKLAWVLGLPAETATENELLAEVMHLVVERGTSTTDVEILRAQLDKMDEQSLSLARLAVNAAGEPSQGSGACVDQDQQHFSISGDGGCYDVRGDGGRGKGTGEAGGGLSLVDIGVGYASSKGTFLSSLSHPGGSGDAAATKAEAEVGTGRMAASKSQYQAKLADKTAAGRRHSPTRFAPNQEVERKVSIPAARAAPAATAPAAATVSSRPKMSRSGGGGKSTKAEGPGPLQRATVAANKRGLTGTGENLAASEAGPADVVATGSAAAAVAAVRGKTGVEVDLPLDENTIRTSFPKTLQGRVVSIDIFCTKVFSEAEKKLEEEEGNAQETGLKMDDIDYEIRVEAYDPVMLKQHVLYIQDDHIKGCLSAHPHLYTLGPHRTRVHQSLAERLILMPEDDVRAEQIQQGRGGSASGSGNDGAGVAGGVGGSGGVIDRVATPSTAASGGGSSGGGGNGGRGGGGGTTSGGGPRKQPNLLLVLIGDAGEIITTEKMPEQDNPDADAEGGGVSAPVKQPHRHAKSAIMQASLNPLHQA